MVQKICSITELSDPGSKEFVVQRQNQALDAFLVLRHGRVYAYVNRCPHTGIGLNWQPDQFLNLEGDLVQCSMHGALFQIDNGLCIRGPCQGLALTQLAVEVHDGVIYASDDTD